MNFDGRWIFVENYHWWMKTFNGRLPLMEDSLWWRSAINLRWPFMEDNLQWKETFDGGWPLMEDDLWWKTTSDGKHPLMEDDLCWKTTFYGRRTLMEENLCGRRPLMEDVIFKAKLLLEFDCLNENAIVLPFQWPIPLITLLFASYLFPHFKNQFCIQLLKYSSSWKTSWWLAR